MAFRGLTRGLRLTSRQNPEHYLQVTSACHPKVFVDHGRDLSTTEERSSF